MTRGHLRLVSPPTADGTANDHNDTVRVLLVEDYARIRQGLAAILRGSPDIEIAEERVEPEAIMKRIGQWHPDVISLAVQLDGKGGFELLDRVRLEAPEARIVVLTMQRSAAFAQRALERGASGVVLKDHADSELIPAVEAAAGDETYVSPLIAFS